MNFTIAKSECHLSQRTIRKVDRQLDTGKEGVACSDSPIHCALDKTLHSESNLMLSLYIDVSRTRLDHKDEKKIEQTHLSIQELFNIRRNIFIKHLIIETIS